MFRLVKVLNNNTQADVHLVPINEDAVYGKGEAIVTSDGKAATPSSTAFPDYIVLSKNLISHPNKIDAMIVTENSVFKVEYTGSLSPYLGMPVGLSRKIAGMDAVTYNVNGKGNVIGIDDDKRFVYVRFRK